MIQKRLIVTGKVQDVNYREIVKEIAQKMEILGSIRNLRNGTVEIFCECKNKQHLEDFKKEIWRKEKNKDKLFVNDIEEIPISNAHLSYFDIDYGDKQEEIIKKLNKGIHVMSSMNKNLGNKMDNMNKNLGNKMDNMNDNVNDRFDKMEQKYGVIGRTLLIIALETVKDKKRKKMLEDILEEEVKLETKKHDER